MSGKLSVAQKPLVAALALALCHVALAQQNTTATPTLREVQVSDTKITPLDETANRLSANDLATRRAATSDSASLFSQVPGVNVYSAGGVSSLPVIHGLADDRLRIKIDGMDLIASCPNHMNSPLSYLDPSQVETAKVYAGITPVSLGGDSLGGAIVVNSKAPKFAAPGQGTLMEGEVGAFYRSNGNAQGGNASATFATESLSLSYSGATAKASNYKAGDNFKSRYETGRTGHTLALDEVGSTAYKSTNHLLGVAVKGGNHLLEAKIGIQDMPYQLYPNQRMDLLNNEQKSFNLRYLGQYDWGKLEARAYHEKVDHYMDFGADKRWWYGIASGGGASVNPTACGAPSATCAQGMPMYTASKTTGFNLKGDVALSQTQLLRVGAEYQTYRLNDWWPASGSGMWPDTFNNINNGERDRKALFAELESQTQANWATLLGVRFEQVKMDTGTVHGYSSTASNQTVDANAFNARNRSRTDNNIDLSALARYTANVNLDIELGLSHKTRSPNLYEAYTWSTWQMAALMNNFVGDGNGYLGNPDLKPEKANKLAATFDWHSVDRQSELKLTPYYTQVTDYIDAVQWNATTNAPRTPLLSNQFTVLRYTNQSARIYGLDLSGKMPLAKSAIGELGLKGMVNYTRGTNRDTGGDLYNIMPLNGKLVLTQKTAGWDNALEIVGVSSKQNVSTVRNEMKTPGYSLVNLRLSHRWKQVRVDFGVENLFDRHYQLPLGGAYLGQGTTMMASANNVAMGVVPLWGVVVPGMGRSIYAGVNIKF